MKLKFETENWDWRLEIEIWRCTDFKSNRIWAISAELRVYRHVVEPFWDRLVQKLKRIWIVPTFVEPLLVSTELRNLPTMKSSQHEWLVEKWEIEGLPTFLSSQHKWLLEKWRLLQVIWRIYLTNNYNFLFRRVEKEERKLWGKRPERNRKERFRFGRTNWSTFKVEVMLLFRDGTSRQRFNGQSCSCQRKPFWKKSISLNKMIQV